MVSMALKGDILSEFNRIAISLTGLPLLPGDKLKKCRLEHYALVILFYQLADTFPEYTYEVVLPFLSPGVTIDTVLSVND